MAKLKKLLKKSKGKEQLIVSDYPETLFSNEPQPVRIFESNPDF